MKHIITFDYHILNEYSKWENANKGNWDILSYLNQFYDINAALAFSKLYFPDFIEIDGCIILESRYDKKIFKSWVEKFGDDKPSIEKMCNLYEVKDYFHINIDDTNSELKTNELTKVLSYILKRSLEVNLKYLYPDREIAVEVFDKSGSTYITFFSVPLSTT